MLKLNLVAVFILSFLLFSCTDPGPGASSSSSSGGGSSSTSSSSSSSGMPSCQNGAANYPTCDKFPLQVVITEPKSLATVGLSPLKVKGTVSKPGAILVVNGTTIEYSNGKFEANVPIEDGYNVITAGVTLGTEQTSDTISVSFDKTPPYVTVESHTDGQTVTTNTITVTGLVNDIVRGTIEAQQAQVRVNGVSAQVSNRSYAAKNIPLQEGTNTLQITAADQVGNTESISLKVIYKKPLDKRIELAGGQDQSTAIDSELPAPLSVKLVDASGAPVVNTPVVFRVIQDSGALTDITAAAPQNNRALMAKTNTQGIAQAKFKVGLRTGVANNKVKVTAVGFEGSVVFNASATTKYGDKLSINSGNNQRGSIGQVLPAPFITVVTDEGANTVKGARVQFEVIKGGGHFENNQTRTEAVTDSDGRVSVRYILGEEEGIDAQHVRATLLDGTPGKTIIAGFNATAFKAGDPGQTSVTGVVLDNQDKPIPGITLHIKGTTRKVQSDDQGRFEITSAPVGPIELIADGSTAQTAGEYPNLSFHLVTIAGAKNPLPAPIYMVKLNTKEAVFVGPKDVELTLEKYPGFKLEIAKNSVTFPDGAREGYVSVTAVNAAAVPMAPPNGMQPRFIVTIQPTNTRFDAPARLTLPNVDGHKPGAQVEMYSYDHDLEEFVSIGLGTVSEDGTVVRSNPGVGVIKAGWHCGSQPGGSGTAENCPECEKCDGTTCIKDPAQADNPFGRQVAEDCKTATCGGSKPEPSDKPTEDKIKYDCKKPGCDGDSPNFSKEINDTDINPLDVTCNECIGGELTKKPNGDFPNNECKYCFHGVERDKPDGTLLKKDACMACKNGVAEKNYDETFQVTSGNFNEIDSVEPIVNKLNTALSHIGAGTRFTLEPSANASVKKRDCCEQSSGVLKKGDQETEGSVGIKAKFNDVKIWGPPTKTIKFDLEVVVINVGVRAGVYLNTDISITAVIGHRINQCKNEDCKYSSLTVPITFTPKVLLEAVACTESYYTTANCQGISVTPVSFPITFSIAGGYNVRDCKSGPDVEVTLAEIKFVFTVKLGLTGAEFNHEEVIYEGKKFK